MNIKIFTISLSLALASCGGTTTFNEYARAGDTVAVSVGMQPDFSKDNITVTITPSIGADIIINSSDPAIRGIVNFYPDPVSHMQISRAIGEDTSTSAQLFYDTLRKSTPSKDKDFYQTTVFIDLPDTLPTGLTAIEINNGLGPTDTTTLEIIAGIGTPHSFSTDFDEEGTPISADMFASMARADHTTITLQKTPGTNTPYAIELSLSHDPDKTVNGAGKAYIINPFGYLTNLTWSDDGINMKIIVMPSGSSDTLIMKDFKLYVAGTATNLVGGAVKGYDINGNDISLASGLTATLTPNN